MNADPALKIPRRLGSQTKRREFESALMELLVKEWDDERIESWVISDNKDKDDADGGDDADGDDDGDNHAAYGVAQGVSSDITGATGDTPERINIDPAATRKGLSNPELRNALHPVVTSSSFLRTGTAADKVEYPSLHEFKIPVDNDDTIYGIFRDIKKLIGSRESSEQVPIITEGAFVYQFKNSREGLMIPIPTSKSKTGEDKLVAAVKEGIAWATRGNKNAESDTVKALLSELTEIYKKEYVEVGVDKHLCLP